MRILLVEDDRRLSHSLKSSLLDEGYAVDVAFDGDEGQAFAELGELAATFDHMLDRLEAAFTRQAQFTADASHELRTPLTIVNLETNRLLAEPQLSPEQRQSLTTIQQENAAMARLVHGLLLLPLD